MNTLQGRTIFITGASSGIGRSSAVAFAQQGARLILCARRQSRLETLAQELKSEYKTPVYLGTLDVRDSAAVDQFVNQLPQEWAAIDVLLNNAGLSRGLASIADGSIADWDEMIDTNIKGLLYTTRALLPGMLARQSGHVINIGSIAGREVYANGGVYCATKWAVRALTQAIRVDTHGTPIRVTTIDPGLVETEFSIVRFHGDEKRAAQIYEGAEPLTPDDVADCIVFAVSRPSHVTVAELVLLATDQASATQVHRRTKS